MKKHCYSTVLAGVCASTVCVISAQAQSNGANANSAQAVNANHTAVPPTTYQSTTYYEDVPRTKFYFGADAGGALTGDTRVKSFLGSVDSGTKVRLDPGIRFGMVGGYRITDWFSVEGETGVIGNNIKSITGASIDGDATLANVPFLLNARIQMPHGKCPVTPYIGGGAGGSASILSFEHHIDFNGQELHGSDAAVVFAYQAFAGLRYAIDDHMGIGLEYHYLATTGPTWTAHDVGGPNHISFLGVQSHALSVAFDYRF